MTLINTEGMALIGPGSEWFWTAVSGLVLAVTFVAIYRQLRAQASARAFELLQTYMREGEDEPLHRAAIEVMTALRAGSDPTAIPAGPAGFMGGVWEKYALLARRGHVDVRLLWDFAGHAPQNWWLMLAPRTREQREATGDARLLEHLEWLAERMADLDRRAGHPAVSPDDIAAKLDGWITEHTEGLRAARERRTVLVERTTDPGLDGFISTAVTATTR